MRKRSDSSKCFLCESEATATNVFCAKAKRQQQQDVGRGVITGRDAFSLRSSIRCAARSHL
ncbi:hypothetical protein [Lysinibacillus xylanilyticus]|uniref:hypothetical protein n=1 Tax=Lysinibacillus xylanilyticus TaxID=582475 RepID=UPI0013792C44|nr:hypothetical protein [Lysinibacillus xylanilyticus]